MLLMKMKSWYSPPLRALKIKSKGGEWNKSRIEPAAESDAKILLG